MTTSSSVTVFGLIEGSAASTSVSVYEGGSLLIETRRPASSQASSPAVRCCGGGGGGGNTPRGVLVLFALLLALLPLCAEGDNDVEMMDD